ncbi:MAG: hypothetical protein EBT82_03755 [Micrococcales bacterium]|nr:hypothetical protein [Micrococcales bacterium]NBR55072.1 hypothetical protein [Micrococcales bacterium]NBR61330.1 hypothetical protein [Actinomycetota bacterium]NBY43362.1 hypothetical protein [Micrococcales bacterium]NDE89041.1 hypothetical protein [Micrococcales bacterium]
MPENLGYKKLLQLLTKETLELDQSMPIILIDGRACSGKSTLAGELQNELFIQGESLPRIIHLDDLYLGWDGLAEGVDYLKRFILQPLLSKGTASWQEYDWDSGKRNSWREFSGGTPLIVEGCGAINSYTATIANFSVWLSVPEEVRKARWSERDGKKFDQYFDTWAAQELDFLARERSENLANFSHDYEAKP